MMEFRISRLSTFSLKKAKIGGSIVGFNQKVVVTFPTSTAFLAASSESFARDWLGGLANVRQLFLCLDCFFKGF